MTASMIIHVRFDLFGDGSSVQSSFEDVSSQNVIDSRSHGVGGGATGSNFAANRSVGKYPESWTSNVAAHYK